MFLADCGLGGKRGYFKHEVRSGQVVAASRPFAGTGRLFSGSSKRAHSGAGRTAGLAPAEVIEQSDDEVVVQIQQPVDSNRKVWLLPPAADGVSGTVRSCDEIAEGFRVSVLLDRADAIIEPDQTPLGRVSLTWTAADGSVYRARVAIESGAEGELEISVPETVPVPALVLLSSYEYRGLGVAKLCRREKDSYCLTVGMTEEVFPQSNAA